ncbi:MAG: hypothetical protein H6702_19480 [Myxococcales bacterium]|nr:hypothetical protein [Myxococcales bacterium]
MGHPIRHVVHQGPVLAGMGGLVVSAMTQRFRGKPARTEVPGRVYSATVPPRPADLVADYVRWAGGDPRAWQGRVPPHLFPQWGFGLLNKTLAGIAYPVAKALNGGCRMVIHADIPAGQPLQLEAQLVEVDDDGRRAILTQRLETRLTDGTPLLTADLRVFIPLGGGGDAPRGPRKPKPAVPVDAREVAWLRFRPDDGFRFACLTGDFNPVHWIGPYAKAAGFGRTIQHGFGTLARALEALTTQAWAGDTRRLKAVDVRFTKPVKLPAKVGVYTRGQDLFVGTAAGGAAHLIGTFQTTEETPHE